MLLVQDGEGRVRLVGEGGVARRGEGDEGRRERDRVREARPGDRAEEVEAEALQARVGRERRGDDALEVPLRDGARDTADECERASGSGPRRVKREIGTHPESAKPSTLPTSSSILTPLTAFLRFLSVGSDAATATARSWLARKSCTMRRIWWCIWGASDSKMASMMVVEAWCSMRVGCAR